MCVMIFCIFCLRFLIFINDSIFTIKPLKSRIVSLHFIGKFKPIFLFFFLFLFNMFNNDLRILFSFFPISLLLLHLLFLQLFSHGLRVKWLLKFAYVPLLHVVFLVRLYELSVYLLQSLCMIDLLLPLSLLFFLLRC